MEPSPEEANPALKRVFKVKLFTDYDKDLILHWSVGHTHPYEWDLPEEKLRPANTKPFPGNKSVQTLFARDAEELGYKSISLEFPADDLKLKGVNYVFFEPANVREVCLTEFRIGGTTTRARITMSTLNFIMEE